MRLRRAFRTQIALFAALALAVSGVAVAQLQTGDIYGKVVDEKGAPLPGATLTLSSNVGGQKIAQADESGAFRFVSLYPGDYSIKAELSGFSSVEHTGIGVRVGGKAQIELALSSEIKETITVTAEKPVLNPREQNQGVALAAKDLEQVPTARDPWSLLRQAPGVLVDRVNVGGNESGQQSNFIVGGATASDNTFAVDGMIVSDMAAVGSSGSYYDFGAYEEVLITTASTDTSIQTAGVTINQVTKRGTNEWRGDARYLSTEGNWQAQPDDIFVNAPEPHTTAGSSIDGVTEYGANVGGPVVQDHLWLWGSYGESDIKNIIGAAQQQGRPVNLDHTKLKDTNVKLNFQTSSANSGTVHYWDNNKLKFGRSGNWNRPPETTWDQTTPAKKWRLEDTQLFGSGFMLTGMYSNNDGGFTLHPKGGNNPVYQDDDGIWHGSFWVFDQTGTVEQAKLDATNFFNTAGWDNELKYGASYRTQENDSASVLPTGSAVISCVWIGCDETQAVVEWSRYHPSVKTKYQALWAQDTISKDRWTINGGLRYDHQTAQNKAVNDPGVPAAPNGLLPPINFKGDNAQGLDWSTLVPRIGVSYAAGADRRTLLRGSFSQYGSQLGQWVANYVSPTGSYSYVYYYFTDVNGNRQFDPAEQSTLTYAYYIANVNTLDPSTSPNRLAKDFKPYKTSELGFSVQHSFPSNFNMSANVIFRQTKDLLYARDLLVDASGNVRAAVASDYVPATNKDGTPATVTGVLPNGQSVTVPKYKLPGATGGHELSNSDREIDYWGLTLAFQKPLSHNWSMRGNFTYGDDQLKIGPTFKSQDNPENRISLGSGYYGDTEDIFVETSYGSHALVLINSNWSFNVNGIYQVAPDKVWGFDVGGSVSGREGFPYAPSDNTNVRGRQLAKLNDFRLPSVVSFDARLSKDIQIQEFSLTLSIDGFNLLNSQPSLQRFPKAPTTAAGLPTSYSSIENLSPRVFRWGVAMHFR